MRELIITPKDKKQTKITKETIMWLLPFFVLFFSCETDIDIELPEYESKLVIEGYIENGQPPMVMITRSIAYFSTIDPQTLLSEILVTDARVTVTSESGESEVLQFGFDPEAPFYCSYRGRSLGQSNETYTLTVEWNDKIYTGKTSILEPFNIDSMWFNTGETNDSIGTIRLLLPDNQATRDYYQFFVKIQHGDELNDRLWAYTLPLVFDDATFNGLEFSYEILRATPSTLFANLLSDEEKRSYYRSYYLLGDTVHVKYALIDYDSYRFWMTAMSDITFGQNIFMSPPPIESNITCNTGETVRGIWCGYASQSKTLIFSR